MNYLIVDDHSAIRQTVIDVLGQPGDTFTEAATGEAAVALRGRENFDWVIMDVRMPGIGGLAATREITSNHPGSRVVILSQFEKSDYPEQLSQCGALAFVNKERIAELKKILTQISAEESETLGSSLNPR